MRHGLRLLVMLGVLAGSATGVDAADDGAPLEKSYSSWITLDPAGRVLAVEVDAGTSQPVAAVVAGLARELVFEPAKIDGVAVASVVPVGLGVRFTADATGNYVAALRWAKVNALVVERTGPARYPRQELLSSVGGWALASYVIGAEGRIDPASVRILDQGAYQSRRLLGAGHASAKAFAEATRAAVAPWTFRTAQLDGVPVPVRAATPMTFRPSSGRAAPGEMPDFVRAAQLPTPAEELQRAGAVLPQPTGLPDSPPDAGAGTIEITGSRVRRATVVL